MHISQARPEDLPAIAALEARGLRCWALGNGYLVVET